MIMSNSDEKYFMAAMGNAVGVGHKSIAALEKIFGSVKVAWSAEEGDLLKSGVRKAAVYALLAFRATNPDAPEKLVDYCAQHGINLCCINDEDYPPLLKEIDSPPMYFYYRGQLQPHAERVGIVGTRKSTNYGESVAFDFGKELAAAGITVVSGAATGIDMFAQNGALQTGRTVAVLGGGIVEAFSRCYAPSLEAFCEKGAVISEFPPQFPQTAGTLAVRNRIVAGLCRGVIVVETGEKSGTLITANYAKKYGRDVSAVPGSIYSDKSVNCNKLIRDGAIPINSVQDVIEKYRIKSFED